MGMFEYVTIEDENELGLKAGYYQTKDLNCDCESIVITKDGSLQVLGDKQFIDELGEIQQGKYSTDQLRVYSFYTDIIRGLKWETKTFLDGHEHPRKGWVEYELLVVDCKVVKVLSEYVREN